MALQMSHDQTVRHGGRTFRSPPRMRGWALLVGALFALAFVAAACGGTAGEDDRATSSGEGGGNAGPAFSGDLDRSESSFPTSLSGGAAPAAEPGDGGGGFANIDLVGRSIIRSANIDLEVDSVAGAFDDVEAIALSAGGFVADSSFFGRDEERSAHVTLRVPASEFGGVMQQLRGLAADVTSINTNAQDVTEEFSDVNAQLTNLRAVEVRYLELLSEARGITEILQVQDRIDGVRLQIDRLEGRLRLLEDLTDLATISVSLTPAAVAVADGGGSSGPLAAAGDAWQASLDSLEAVATVVLVAVVYSWWLIPGVLVLLFVGVRLRDRITFGRDHEGETA